MNFSEHWFLFMFDHMERHQDYLKIDGY